MDYREKLEDYVPVKLSADLSGLSDSQREMLPLLVQAAQVMDGLFWQQAYGDREALLEGIEDPHARRFAEINYGPWDRLDGNRPFLAGVGPKPPGANYYPPDMTAEEFEAAATNDPRLRNHYTLVRRNAAGALSAVPYNVAFRGELSVVAELLRKAASLAEDGGFRRYLQIRADALESNDYQPSDFAWMEMRDNAIDLVIGPIESYEDRLFGTKTAFEAYVLIKDKQWSDRLAKYSTMLPALQDGLPVPPEYKAEEPGGDSQLNAYDVLYYAGDCNAGAKTIAINLPNDEQVQLEKGSRRLQLKNAMRAKFDNILLPIADILIHEEQRGDIDFEAFFTNTMFHEVAHGLGIKNTLDGRGTVREALKGRLLGARGSQGRHPRPALDRQTHRCRGIPERGPGRQLHDLPRRHLPLRPLRRLERSWPRELNQFQFLPALASVLSRQRQRNLPNRRGKDAGGGGFIIGKNPPPARRRRLRGREGAASGDRCPR